VTGALQEPARPSDIAIEGPRGNTRRAYDQVHGLLPLFDCVSSVSGSGFTAGFVGQWHVDVMKKGVMK
jgi:hypothetical protein